jgi:uncharacterized protein (TIGR02117 family)
MAGIVAQAPRRPLIRIILRIARMVAGSAVLALGLIMLVSWLGSSVPRNADWEEPKSGIDIMVETNGVHTALVLPLVTPEKDWRPDFPAKHILAQKRPYTHVSVSWGEKTVFLETETWGDLKLSTVLKVIGLGGEGLVHVAHYVRPRPGPSLRPLTITSEQYRRIVEQIERFAPQVGTTRYTGYYRHDVFYDAPGRYTPTNTCNQWTSDILAEAGIRTGLWTPFAGGVMKWVPSIGQRYQ